MNCLKKGFPFFGGCNLKNGAWIFRGNKKENTLLHLSLAFRSSSTYRLSLSFHLTVLAYYQRTVPLTLSFHNIPCRSKYSNPRTIAHPRFESATEIAYMFFLPVRLSFSQHSRQPPFRTCVNDIKSDLEKLIAKYCTKFIYVAMQNTPGRRHHF